MIRKLNRGGSTLNKTSWYLNKGTGTNQIATEQEAYNIGKEGSPTANKCVTYARAIQLGCKSLISYNLNQLVKYSDLSPAGVSFALSIGWNNSSVSGTITFGRQNSVSILPTTQEYSVTTDEVIFISASMTDSGSLQCNFRTYGNYVAKPTSSDYSKGKGTWGIAQLPSANASWSYTNLGYATAGNMSILVYAGNSTSYRSARLNIDITLSSGSSGGGGGGLLPSEPGGRL